nr:condensation domain-containing protein [Micromonospora sp. DSM 115978]
MITTGGTTRTVRLRVDGTRAAEGPLTLGQANALRWISALTDDHFLSMVQWIFLVPDGTSLDRTCAALGALVSRYESLRTTFHDGPTGLVQRVARSVELTIEVYAAPADVEPGALSRELIHKLREHPFDLATDLPLRFAVATDGDRVRAAVAVYSHLAVDYVSITVLGQRFTELLDGTAPGGDTTPYQPLDRAARERSARGLRQADAALRYWESVLRRKPRCVLPLPPEPDAAAAGAEPGSAPRSAELYSPAAARALDRIAARTGGTRPMAVLAALAAVLAIRSGQPHVVLYSPAANRLGAEMREYVGTVAQDGLISLDVTQPDYDALVRHAGTALLRANRHSVFDADALQSTHDRVAHERGVAMVRDGVFNNISGNARPDLPVVATAETFIEWWTPAGFPDLLLFHLVRTEPVMILELITGDNRYVPDPEMEALLLGTERVLTAAATANIALADIRAVAEIERVDRDGDWHHLDHGWVQLSHVNLLLRDALPGSARAFVVDAGQDGTGGRRIVAHLTATGEIDTPAKAHLACVRRLANRYTAMAPHRYVLHAGSPADPTDQHAWYDLPVLTEGDGRAAEARSEVQR